MKLFARRTSSNCQKVLWFLGEIGLDYEFVATGGDAGGLDDQAYREMNPNGLVPTWTDEHGSVWESHTLLRYLAATHAPECYWPAHPAARSHIERWMDWSQSGFDPAFMQLFWGYWRTPEADRRERMNLSMVERCAAALETLDGALEGRDYVAGDRLTLADVPVGALMYRYANLGVTKPLPSRVASWYERLCERDPFRTHVMLPFEELKGRLAP